MLVGNVVDLALVLSADLAYEYLGCLDQLLGLLLLLFQIFSDDVHNVLDYLFLLFLEEFVVVASVAFFR